MKPTDIKIGARNYQVAVVPRHQNETLTSNEQVHGFIDYSQSQIVLSKDGSDDFMMENLIHEILHGLLDNSGVEEENIEKTVRVLGPRLHSFLVDNPDFQTNLLSKPRQ